MLSVLQINVVQEKNLILMVLAQGALITKNFLMMVHNVSLPDAVQI